MTSLTTGGSTTTSTYQTNSGMSAFELGTSRSISISGTSTNQALTPTCRFVTLIARGGTHCHYVIGVGAQTATTASHYLATGERVLLTVPAEANIAAISGSGASTHLYISELLQ